MQGVLSVDEETTGSQSHQREKSGRSGGRGGLLVVGFLGAVAGAVAGLLLAPWRGAEARAKLKEGARKAGAAAKEGAVKAGAAGAAAKEKLTAALRRGESEEEDED